MTKYPKNNKNRPTIEEIIIIINKYLSQTNIDKIAELFQEDEVVQNFLIERNIESSIDQVSTTILSRERDLSGMKTYAGILIATIPLNILLIILTGGISLIPTIITVVAGGGVGAILGTVFNPKKKLEFINSNSIIFQTIQKNLN